MLVVNLFAGPGAGKTTLALMVTAELKRRGLPVVVEYVDECAKALIYEGRLSTIRNRIKMLGDQHQRVAILEGKVDIIVTDSPVLLNAVYARDEGYPDAYVEMAVWTHRRFPSLDVYVNRPESAYETAGRMQSEDESLVLDQRFRALLGEHAQGGLVEARPSYEEARRIADMALRIATPGVAA